MTLPQKRSLVRTMRQRTVAVGEMVARCGDESKMLSVVMEGEVKVNQRSAKNGMALGMGVLSAGDLLDEVELDANGVLRQTADLLAVSSHVRLFEIPRAEVEPWLNKRPETCSYKSVRSSRSTIRGSRSEYLNAVASVAPSGKNGRKLGVYPQPPSTARPVMRRDGGQSVRWMEPADKPTAVQQWYQKTADTPERIWPSELSERAP